MAQRNPEQLIKVQGMTCQHCVAAITRAIQAADGEARVEVDLALGQVRVVSALAESELLQIIEEQGYPAAG